MSTKNYRFSREFLGKSSPLSNSWEIRRTVARVSPGLENFLWLFPENFSGNFSKQVTKTGELGEISHFCYLGGIFWEISKILEIYHPQIMEFGEFTKCLGIWGIPQMSGNLGNFQNVWESGKFTKYLGIWRITQIPKNLENSLITRESGEFPKYIGIWGIPQIYLGIWEIPQVPGNLGNSPKSLENLRVVYISSLTNFSNA